MSAEETIVELWMERTLRSYPVETLSFLGGEQDPFRNPVGQTLRKSLEVLAREVLGAMNKDRMMEALDALVRMRAVQDFSPADAVRFVFILRAAIRETTGAVSDSMHSRIDELALMTFDKYAGCREQIFQLRVNELRSRMDYALAGEEEEE
ncbi:MAG: RsbRD N-terminal domain-containing protein [Acidobacteriota bacterium]